MKNKLKNVTGQIIMVSICSASLMVPFVSYAQTTPPPTTVAPQNQQYTLIEPLPEISSTTGNASISDKVNLVTYIQDAINLMIALAAVAAVFMIVWGGLQYMTTDSWGGKTAGREKATNAVIGLLMTLSTYIILKTVNPNLVNVASIPPICNTVKPGIKANGGGSTLPDAGGNCPKLLADNLQSTQSIFDKITQDAQQYNIQTKQVGDQIAASKDEVTKLQSTLSSLQTQYNQATDPAVKSQLETQINDTQNQIYDAQALAALRVAQLGMQAQMNGGNSNLGVGTNGTNQAKTLKDVQNSENLVTKAYNEGVDEIMNYGGDSPDNIQALDNTYYYTYGNLFIQDQILQMEPLTVIPILEQKIKNDFIAKMTDPTQKAGLQQSYDWALKLLCPNAQNIPAACKTIGQ